MQTLKATALLAISLISVFIVSNKFIVAKERSIYLKSAPLANNLPIKTIQSKMKTIGILGGFGPQATMEIEQQLHKFSQELIPQDHNSGYPDVIVSYQRHAPFVLDDQYMPVLPIQADPRLLESAKKMGQMVDFIIIPSNGVHTVEKEIEQAAGKPVLSMIDVTMDEAVKKQWMKIGVLGYRMKPMIYINRFGPLGIAYETIDEAMQQRLDVAITNVMEGKNNEEDSAITLRAIEQLRSKGADGIILGCTEIPLLLGKHANERDLLNPSLILAEAAVKFSLTNAD